MRGAPGPEVVFLVIVEVWFEGYAGGGFFLGSGDGAEVDAVVFGAGLEEDAFWGYRGEGQGVEEVLEEGD